jgi:3,4-dihydroxy 2-butanone 4-phosphate synthase/GTP cyclohydrolase II
MATGTDPAATILAEIEGLRSSGVRCPQVTLSYAQSLDGCLTTRRGERFELSGLESRRLTHRLRAAHDAILVGIGTVLVDDPRLTARLVPGKNPQPVVLDSRLRFPAEARLLISGSPWIATTAPADPTRLAALERAGAQVLVLPASDDGRVDPGALLGRLGELGIGSLMVEGGAAVIGSFLRERLVNFIVLTIAPLFLGGLPSVEIGRAGGLPRLADLQFAAFGQDLVIWGRPVWQEALEADEGKAR